jgi:hypothetical protein
MPRNKPFHEEDNSHLESNTEYHRRIQSRMDEDSWQGVDTVGARHPERAIVHDMTRPDEQEPPHIYNWGPRKAGY